MMAAALGCHASDLVASFGIVSGAQLEVGDICAPTHPTAVITLHGTADSVLPYNGDAETPSVQATVEFWATHNRTESEPTRDSATSGTMTIERSTYSGGTNGVSVVHYRYQEGQHVWFSEEYEGDNASALVWNFTTRHNIQGAL
jgi:polyhydroxybutyrate depolymerase